MIRSPSQTSSPRRSRRLALTALAIAALALLAWRATRAGSNPGPTPDAVARPAGLANDELRGRSARWARAPRAQIAGVVVDAGDTPVAGATVGVAGRALVTDAAGRFVFAGLDAGTYVLHAHAGSRAAGPIRIDVVAANHELIVRLHPGVELTATVVSVVDGRPVPGARGTLAIGAGSELGGQLDATAGADGVLRFPAAALGNYQLSAAADGFAPETRALTWNDRAGLRWDVTVALEPGVVIAGRVIDDRGAGVAGALVRARPPARARTQVAYRPRPPDVMRAPVATDRDGRFAFAVPTGQGLVLTASHPRYVSGESPPIVAAHAAEVTIELAAGRRLAGRVVDATGAPVAGAVVTDGPPGADPAHLAYTDPAGQFELTGLAPGRPRVAVFAEARGARALPVLVDLETIADAPVELVLDQTLALAGVVVAADGAPLADAIVHYQRRLSPTYRVVAEGPTTLLEAALDGEVRADGAGQFALAGLAPGDYELLVRAPAAGPTRVSPPAMVSVVVPAGATDVVIAMAAAATVRGRVVARDGGPVAAEVNLVQFGGPVRVDDDGRFELTGVDPAPGRYQVRIGARDALPVVVEAAVVAGQTTDLGTIELTRGRTLRGRVVEHGTGGPVAGAIVTVDSVEGQPVATTRTDELGGYAVAVPDGPVVVRAAMTSVGGSRLITVPADGERADLRLPETGRLEAVVHGDGPVTVTASRVGGADGNFRVWVLEPEPGTGRFAADIAPGRYVVHAARGRRFGRPSAELQPGGAAATIVGGDAVRVEVMLAP